MAATAVRTVPGPCAAFAQWAQWRATPAPPGVVHSWTGSRPITNPPIGHLTGWRQQPVSGGGSGGQAGAEASLTRRMDTTTWIVRQIEWAHTRARPRDRDISSRLFPLSRCQTTARSRQRTDRWQRRRCGRHALGLRTTAPCADSTGAAGRLRTRSRRSSSPSRSRALTPACSRRWAISRDTCSHRGQLKARTQHIRLLRLRAVQPTQQASTNRTMKGTRTSHMSFIVPLFSTPSQSEQ